MKPPSKFRHTREATSLARELRRTASKTERRLWPYLCDSKLGAPFRRQHRIGPHYADYCCVPLKLVVEVDGPTHSLARDTTRDAAMAKLGFEVMRFTVEDVDKRRRDVIDQIYWRVRDKLVAAADPHLSSPFQGEEP